MKIPNTEHCQKYEALAQSIGVENLLAALPKMATVERVQAALKAGDEHLNTIPLGAWDKVAGFVMGHTRNYMAHPIFQSSTLSTAERVCVLKHVAKYHLHSKESVAV